MKPNPMTAGQLHVMGSWQSQRTANVEAKSPTKKESKAGT